MTNGPWLPLALAALTIVAPPAVAVGDDAKEFGWPDLADAIPHEGGGAGDAAVIVGVEDYAFIPDVAGAQDNAEQWYEWLRSIRGVPLTNTQLVRDEEATKESILEQARAATTRVQPDGTLWFVFPATEHRRPTAETGCWWASTASPPPRAFTNAPCPRPTCSTCSCGGPRRPRS